MFNFFSFCGVLNIELPKYKSNLTTTKPFYLAQPFSAVVLKTRLFSLPCLLRNSCSYLFSCDVVSLVELPQSKSGTVRSGRNVNVFPWGLVISGICLLGNLNVRSPLHQGSFFSPPSRSRSQEIASWLNPVTLELFHLDCMTTA